MAEFFGFFLFGMTVLSAIEIPVDKTLTSFPLEKRGVKVWLKEHIAIPPLVAFRFVTQDPTHGKPQIFDLDCPANIFEEELPSFLDYCEEEIQKKGGAPIGVVAVGSMDAKGLQGYLENRYDQICDNLDSNGEPIQLIPIKDSQEFDVLLSYSTDPKIVRSDDDLKKLWVFYLIQSMAENRFKKVAIDGSCGSNYLLPTLMTVGHGASATHEGLLNSFLQAIQTLKKDGFTDSELADSKSQLIKHIKRSYETNPGAKTFADYYAAHMASSIPCLEYSPFMTLSFQIIPEIGLADVTEMLNASFKDHRRAVVIQYPEERELSKEQVEATLANFACDQVEVKTRVELDEERDPFSQLLITPEEQVMICGVIKTVAETSLIKLAFVKSDLEDKRKKLMHIHPLRSLATMCSDPPTKKCLAEILTRPMIRGSFIGDLSDRISDEASQGNLMMYVPGFCLTVKANPDQVRTYIKHKEWENLVKYLIKLSN